MRTPRPTDPELLRPAGDPAHDVFRGDRGPLASFFRPKSVALIGASEAPGSVGRTLLENLSGPDFTGRFFPVNPKRDHLLGLPTFPRLSAVPEPVDLAVIATPAPTVPEIVGQCADLGVPAAIVISAGFKEHGPAGAELERQVLERAAGRLRVLGPNCLGLMCPPSGLNATFATPMARSGSVAFLSQSGALCTSVLDWSLKKKIGFSAFVSVGSMLDVGWGDLIDYLGNDPGTESIVMYMESVGDARSFLSAAREVALNKPIIVIKAGRTAGAAQAAVSHTGSLVGRDDVLDAAFERVGVTRVDEIGDLFHMAAALAKQPRPRGPRLTVLTNAGGPGVLAADALLQNGGALAVLSPQTKSALDECLPAPWSHGNPVDVLGDADPERFARAFEIAAADPASDGVLVVLSPQAMTDPTGTAHQLVDRLGPVPSKTVLASWMGGAGVEEGRRLLSEAGVPTIPYPDAAARIFCTMWAHSARLQSLAESDPSTDRTAGPDASAAAALLGEAQGEGRSLLTEWESKRLLSFYGIPTVPTERAENAEAAVRAAERIGFPVVVKLHSLTITHKSDVGGVMLNLGDAAAVREAFERIRKNVSDHRGPDHFQGVTVQAQAATSGLEVICGSTPDPQFGPVLLFGTGGKWVEVYQDKSLGLPPLTPHLARRMMEKTKVWAALQGARGLPPADLPALERVMVRLSELVLEQPIVKELEINPLVAGPNGVLTLDARVVLHSPEEVPRRVRPAIRPYPIEHQAQCFLRSGGPVVLRPIRPSDEAALAAFHGTLSERTVLSRYLAPFDLSARTAPERLRRVCFTDYDRELVMVACPTDAPGAPLWAVGRLSRRPGEDTARFSLLVADPHQNKGLGTLFLNHLLRVAEREGLASLWASIRQDNAEMLKVLSRLGFDIMTCADGTCRARRILRPGGAFPKIPAGKG